MTVSGFLVQANFLVSSHYVLFNLFQGKKLLVIGTTSEVTFLESVGICDAFAVTYLVPTLKSEDAKKVFIVVFILVFGYQLWWS